MARSTAGGIPPTDGGTPPSVTRAELLGGLRGRRVSTVLYAIERRTAYVALRARHAVAPAICEDMVATRERAFLSALAAGRGLDGVPDMRQLERFARAWAHLVPDDVDARVDLAWRLAQRHRFRVGDVPTIRATLGLDEPAVREAFARRHGRPLETIYAARLPARDRWRWLRARVAARLEGLPPFWAAFGLTLTQTVGAGILALPIALAGVGPLPGVALLAVLGLINVVTAAAVAEAFARTGSVRWGGAYFGRVVSSYLGGAAGVMLTVSLAAFTVVALLAYYVGLSTTLEVTSGVPAVVWAAALFAVTLGFVWRGRLEATVAGALLVGVVNIAIVVVLSLWALSALDRADLTHAAVPFVGGRAFDPGLLDLIFGVVLLAFFGHTAVGNGAGLVLQRDPSGRALVRGTAAAMVTALALYALWCVAVGGAVAPARLARESGTALAPLAEAVGTQVLVVGSVLVILAMGMAAIQFSIGLHHQATELVGRKGRRGRLAGLVPLVAVFLLVEVLLATDRESFTGALGLVGTLTAPLLAGVFPILLLAAARRRGGYVPIVTVPGLGRPTARVLVAAVFVAAIVAHAAVIWQAAPARVAAATVAVAAVALTVWVVRAGAFRPAAVVELRRDRELGRDRLRITADGRHGRVAVRLDGPDGGRDATIDGAVELPERTAAVTVDLDPLAAEDLQVWMHRVDPAGGSEPLTVEVTLNSDGASTPVPLTGGRATRPLPDSVGRSQLVLDLGGGRPADGDGEPDP